MSKTDPEAASKPGNQITLCCVTRTHWQRPAGAGDTNTVTIVRGAWAFCPHNAMAEGHDWRPTGGIDIAQLRRMVRRGDPKELLSRRERPVDLADERTRRGAKKRRTRT